MNKNTFQFKKDYNSKHGIVKARSILTGEIKENGKVIFYFYEKTDSDKSASGEGFFTLTPQEAKEYLLIKRGSLSSTAKKVIDKTVSKSEKGTNSSDSVSETKKEANEPKYTFTHIGSALGFVSGVAYSFHKKTGFWKGLGITFIFNIVGITIGGAIDYSINQKKTKENGDGK